MTLKGRTSGRKKIVAFTPLSCPSPQPWQDPVPRCRTDEREGCLLSWGNWTKGS